MSGFSDTIVLLSSDEESPPRKKAKWSSLDMDEISITPIINNKNTYISKKGGAECICISSEDEQDIDNIKYFEQTNDLCTNGSRKISKNELTINASFQNNDSDEESCEIVTSQKMLPDIGPIEIEDDGKVVEELSVQYEKQVTDTVEDMLENSVQSPIRLEVYKNIAETGLSTVSGLVSVLTEKNQSILVENQDVATKNITHIKLDIHTEENESSSKDRISNKPVDETNEHYINSNISSKNLNLSIDENMQNILNEPKTSQPNSSTHENMSVPNISSVESNRDFTNTTNLITTFVEVCQKTLVNSKYDISSKFELLRKYCNKCKPKLVECPNFNKMIENNIVKANISPEQAVISFAEIFYHLKDFVLADTVEVSKKTKAALKKLERTIRLLVSKIKELENAELDFEEEENSSYMQLDRYINRLNKVYHKYCEFLKSNPYSGRITYSKLDFVDSKYNEINRAISKKYKNNKIFPSYYDLEIFIRKVVKDTQMGLTESQIKTESAHCFKKLGEVLQMRRKRELYDTHCMYIQDSADDPANKDPNLQKALKSNFVKAQTQIETLCQEYVTKHDHGGESEISDKATEPSDNETENAL